MKNLVLTASLLIAGSLMGNAQMVGNIMNVNKVGSTTDKYNFNEIESVTYNEDGSQMLLTPKSGDVVTYNVLDINNITFSDINLLLNPGFEDVAPIWTGNAKSNVNFDKASASEFNASCVISGNGSMRFAGVSAAAYSDQTITVEKGKTYSFGFTGRIQDKVGPAGTDLTHNDYAVVMTVRKKVDGKWVNLADALKVTVNTNTKVSGTVTIGDDCPDTINILFSKNKGIAYIDDAYFIESIFE